MRRTVVGAIAVITVGSVFTLTGLGIVNASSLLPYDPPGAAATSAPTSEATTLQNLHDALAAQWNAKDVAGMRATQSSLAAELATLPAPVRGNTLTSSDAATTTSTTQQQNTELGQELTALQAPHGKSASDLAPPDLSSLGSLISSLLAGLLALISGLLGSLPIPLSSLPVTPPPAG
jgi:hypothetical protein